MNPEIYIADLGAYNNGKLIGKWIDATLSPEDLTDEAQALLKEGEEWAIHDYQNFGSFKIGEYNSFEFVSAVAKAIEKHGEVMAAYLNNDCPQDAEDVERAVRNFDENYQGEYSDLEDWAEQFLQDNGGLSEMPESLRMYFDYASWASDAEMSGDIMSLDVDGKVHVFWNR